MAPRIFISREMRTLVLITVYVGCGPLLGRLVAHALVKTDSFTEDLSSKLEDLQQSLLLPGEGLFVLVNECINATGLSGRDAANLGALFRNINETEGVRYLVGSMEKLLGPRESNSFRDCMAESIDDVLEKCAKLVCVTSSEEEDLKGGFHSYLWSLALKRSRFLENIKKLGHERGFNFVMCGVDPLVRSSNDT